MNNLMTIAHRYLCFGLIAFASCVLLASSTAGDEAEFTIEAREFDSGNARVSLTGGSYADAHSCIWNAGEVPNWVEYEVNFPVAAEYAIWALYAAEQARPVEIRLDGVTLESGFRGTTGAWITSSAKWEQQCTARITEGTHTIRLHCEGAFPHICALRFTSPTANFQNQTAMRTPPCSMTAGCCTNAGNTVTSHTISRVAG